MADKISKYTFEEVEKRLDIIKDDQGEDKVLLGNGTYGDYPDITQYVTISALESQVQETVDRAVEETVDKKIEETVQEVSNSDIDSLFQ